jgi:hypothetical protein
MKVRARVAAVVIVMLAAVVALAAFATRDSDIARQAFRTSVEVQASCGLPSIHVDDRSWGTDVRAPVEWSGVVVGTLWVSGSDAVFIADDGASIRYTLLEDGAQPAPSCATNS